MFGTKLILIIKVILNPAESDPEFIKLWLISRKVTGFLLIMRA